MPFAPPSPPPRRRRGMTLVEVALSTVVVGVMFAAAMQTVAASRKGERITADRGRAQALASDLLEEILDKAYADSSDSPTVFGPTGAEAATGNRSLFNDVNDYRNWTETPPKRTDGTNLDALTGWQRRVTIEFLNPANYAAVVSTDQGVARVIVQVIRGSEIARLAAIRTSGLPATQACKLAGNTCADLVPARCTALGGAAQGAGTSCWTLPDRVDPTAVALWKLDETSGTSAADSASPGGHTGTLTNGPTWGSGQINGALVLDGTNDYVNVGNASDLSLTVVTIAAWIHPSILTNYRTVLHKGTATNRRNYFLQTYGTSISFGFYSTASTLQRFTTTGVTLTANTWHHVAATFDDATDAVRIYLNGTLVGSWSTTAIPATNNNPLEIGRSPYGDYWAGRLDDVRIYNRALTAAEVQMLVNGDEP